MPCPLVFLLWRSSLQRKRVAAVMVAVGLRVNLPSRLQPQRAARETFASRTWRRSREKLLACRKQSSTALLLQLLLLVPPLLLLLPPL